MRPQVIVIFGNEIHRARTFKKYINFKYEVFGAGNNFNMGLENREEKWNNISVYDLYISNALY